jgi:hypothetical protein
MKVPFLRQEKGLPTREEHRRSVDRFRLCHFRLGASLKGRIDKTLQSSGSYSRFISLTIFNQSFTKVVYKRFLKAT